MSGTARNQPPPSSQPNALARSLRAAFRPLISSTVKSKLPVAISNRQIDLLEIDAHLLELSEELRPLINEGFSAYGLAVPQLYVTNVVLPENDPNFQLIRQLHTAGLQQRLAAMNADVESARAASDAAIAVARRAAILQEQTTQTEVLRREAERQIIQAQYEAQTAALAAEANARATQVQGLAEAEVMRAKGYTERDVLAADVQKAYAAGLGQMGSGSSGEGGSSGGSLMGDMLGLGVGLAATGAVMPQLTQMMQGINPNGGAFTGQGQAASPYRGAGGMGQMYGQAPLGTAPAAPFGAASAPFGVTLAAPATVTCPACGAQTPAGKFCTECGGALPPQTPPPDEQGPAACPSCGAELSGHPKFCPECGCKLG